MPLVFEKTPVPVATYGVNPYVDAVKSIIDVADNEEGALTFIWDVTNGGVRRDFDKIKRELQAAGTIADVTVRSYIYDDESGRKLTLPSVRGAELKLSGTGDQTVDKITTLKVVFWVTDKIIRADSEEDDTE